MVSIRATRLSPRRRRFDAGHLARQSEFHVGRIRGWCPAPVSTGSGDASYLAGAPSAPNVLPPLFPPLPPSFAGGVDGYTGGFHVRPEPPVPGFNFVPPHNFGLATFGYDTEADATPAGPDFGGAESPADDTGYFAYDPFYRPPPRDRVREALDQIAGLYAGFGHDRLNRPDDTDSGPVAPQAVGMNGGVPPANGSGFHPPYAMPVSHRSAPNVGRGRPPSVPEPASPPRARYQALQAAAISRPSPYAATAAAAVRRALATMPYGFSMPQGTLGSLAGDMARLGARAAPALAGGATAAAAAVPLLVVPTNTQSETIELGDGLRARLRPGQRSVEIERQVEDGLLGTGFGARWERVPVDAEQGAGPDGAPSVFIDHGQLVDAVGPEAAARAWDAIGSAMARPRGRSGGSQPPAGRGRNADETPDPENGGRPPTGGPDVLPSSRQSSKESSSTDRDHARFATRHGLERDSATTQQILENLDMNFETFVGRYRQGRIRRRLPDKILQGTVREALESGDQTVRKLLTNRRFHR